MPPLPNRDLDDEPTRHKEQRIADTAREATGAARRHTIVRAALEEFSARGYRGASLALIAGRVGITQQAVLYHFGSKEQLLVEALDERDRQDREWWAETAASQDGSLDFLDLCERLVERNTAQASRSRLLTILAADSTTADHPAHAFFQARYARLRKVMAEDLDETLARSDRSGPSVAVVLAVMDGLKLQWLLDPEGFDMVAEFRTFVASVRGT